MKTLGAKQVYYVPKKLELTDKPELNVFPYNVLIARNYIDEFGSSVFGYVVYEPDLNNIKKEENQIKVNYYNINDKKFRLEFSYNIIEKSYVCTKYENEFWTNMAPGKKWNDFFKIIGSFGISKGESCKLEDLYSTN